MCCWVVHTSLQAHRMAPNEAQVKQRIIARGNDEEDELGRKLIGYRGQWYDITDFIPKHPGGKLIEHFVGQDATYEIEIYHYHNVMKHKKPVKSNKKFLSVEDDFSEDMIKLQQKLKDEGYFSSSGWWYVMKCFLTMSFFAVSVSIALTFGHSYWGAFIAGLVMALFWQQSAQIMHDFLHNEATQNITTGEIFGTWFCTVCFGMSSRGWKEEHNEHHVMTNVADHEKKFVDPQTFQDVFAQNVKLFDFVKPLMRWHIKIQALTFFPLLVMGRLRIIARSYAGENRKDVMLAIAAHWIWVIALLMQFPTWKHAVLFYWAAGLGEGLLHLQLLINHYPKPYFELKERYGHSHFYQNILPNITLVTPAWMDWFHGSMNFHIEHHCFPRLTRHRYREVSPMIKEICKKHGVPYDESSFYGATKRTVLTLWEASKLYKLLEMS